MIYRVMLYVMFVINAMKYGGTENAVTVFNKMDDVDNKVTMAFVGDVMIHGPQLKAQYDAKTRNYSFANNFEYVEKYIESADLAVLNLETTLAGEDKGGYTSFPRFNSPDQIAMDLKNAGFDVFCIANNHMLDRGAYGLNRTMDILEALGLEYTGAKKNKSDKNYIIINKNGINIGITAYTYENDAGGRDALNGNIIPKGYKELINTFDTSTLESDLMHMKDTVKHMKDDGAECIIFQIHWGNEYQERPNKYQEAIAEYLCKNGVNVIVGNHPHILQKFDKIKFDENETYVFYSVGNFLSNQRYEILKQRLSENGIIVYFDVNKLSDGRVYITNPMYVPTWVNKYLGSSGKYVYEILPLNEPLSNFKLSYQKNKWRAENALKTIKEVVESGNMGIKLKTGK